MLQLAALFVFAAALQHPTSAQVEFEWSGYVVDLPMYQRMPDVAEALGPLVGADVERDMAVNLTRLRLRPTLRLWEGASLSLEHEVDVTAATQSLLFGAVPDITNRQMVDLRWHPVEEEHLWMQHYVDRLYFLQNFLWGSIIAGRQRISWGTGRIWNPTWRTAACSASLVPTFETEEFRALGSPAEGPKCRLQAAGAVESLHRGRRAARPVCPDAPRHRTPGRPPAPGMVGARGGALRC